MKFARGFGMQIGRLGACLVSLVSLSGCSSHPAVARPLVPNVEPTPANPNPDDVPVQSPPEAPPAIPAVPTGPAGADIVTPPPKPTKTSSAAESSPPSEPGSCEAGMVLVEGDYCSEVKHDCLVEWFAPQNKKVVCEQFAPKATCVGSKQHKRYCIDRFEWPNQKGVRPEVMNTFYQAQVKCAAAGKRMCSESEWNLACEGPDMKPFPYGYVRDPHRCNGDHRWDNPGMTKVAKRDAKELARLWRGVPSGTQGCVSDYGVEDMPGNADEVCAGETATTKFSSVHTGGPWYSGVRNQCRPKVYTHAEDFYYYFLSFRCCSNPDGAANEFRTLKQIKDGMPWSEVERLAGFTVDDMKSALALKKEGKCACDGRFLDGKKLRGPAYMCDTMCGTLLGPDAVDGSDATRVLHKERRKLH